LFTEHSIELRVLRIVTHALVVHHFSIVARRYGCASIAMLVPVWKSTVVAVASEVRGVPNASSASIDWLAVSPHVEVVGIVTHANVSSSSDLSVVARILTDFSDKVSSVHAYAR